MSCLNHPNTNEIQNPESVSDYVEGIFQHLGESTSLCTEKVQGSVSKALFILCHFLCCVIIIQSDSLLFCKPLDIPW